MPPLNLTRIWPALNSPGGMAALPGLFAPWAMTGQTAPVTNVSSRNTAITVRIL